MSAHDGNNAFVDQLVDACLEEADRFTQGVVEKVCEENPREAESLKRRYRALRESGLVGPVPENGPAPDPWMEGAREALADADTAFDAIGPYQPLKELGRGGQAVVYLAEDLRLHRPVALKVLKGLGPLSKTVMSRFRREAEVASKLDHPGICAVFDAGVQAGVPYIAMRFVAGDTLGDRIANAKECTAGDGDSLISVGAETKTEINRLIALIEHVARALHVAHEVGIIHRDVKPGNIMVTPDDTPVLLDFGLAGDEDGGLMTLTETNDVVGTPAYMSPEQLVANRLRLDRRTDVYSLGVTLFECLTLERPFTANTRDAMYRAIQYEDPTDVRGLNAALPTDLKVVIETALEKDRDKRYRTAEAFAEDLRRVRMSEPISARAITPVGRVIRWAKRRPMRAALLLVLAIGIPLLTGLVAHAIATRPAILEAERQAFLAEVEGHLERGYDELGHGDPAEALASFDAALALKGGSVEAIGGKAFALWAVGDYASCLEFIDSVGDVPGGAWALRQIRLQALDNLGRKRDVGALVRAKVPGPTTALDFFLAGQTLMVGCKKRTDKRVFRRAYDHFEQAALTAPRARYLYHYQVAHAAQHLGDERAARRAAMALLALWPESPIANHVAGNTLRPFDPSQAIQLLEKAIAPNPNDASSHTSLGYAYKAVGRVDEAIASYRAAISLDPDCADAHLRLGIALLDLNRVDDAIDALRKTTELAPDDASGHDFLGTALGRKGLIDESVVAHRAATRANPRDHQAWVNLGVALCETGQEDDAVAAYRKAIEVNPSYMPAHHNYGMLLQRRGEHEEAIACLQKAVRLQPDHAHAQISLGLSLSRLRREDEAIACYEAALRVRPGDWNTHVNLSISLGRKKQPEKALAAADKALALQPDNPQSHYWRATALAGLDRHEDAIASYERAVTLDPNYARAYNDLGSAFWASGRLPDALASFRRSHVIAATERSRRALAGCEVTMLRKARRLMAMSPDADAWIEAALLLDALIAGWGKDLDRDDRGAAIDRWLEALGRSGWTERRDPKNCKGLPASEHADWRAIWTDLDALVERRKKNSGPPK